MLRHVYMVPRKDTPGRQMKQLKTLLKRRFSPGFAGVRGKFRLADNQPLSDKEYQLACAFCDVIDEVLRVGKMELPGGIFWGEVGTTAEH